MPHIGQNLPLAAQRGIVALVLAVIAVGCARSGDVIVVIDSTMRGEPVEVVAIPVAPRAASPAAPGATAMAGDSAARLMSMRDSVAMLEARFRALRDTLERDVRMLDTADRTTRAYATQYAAIRRRTVAAEAVRSSRDSLRRREEAFRMALGSRAAVPGPGRGAASPAAPPSSDTRASVRAMTVNGTVTLSLAPGAWSIGLASGSGTSSLQTVSVERGMTQTVRITPSRSGREP